SERSCERDLARFGGRDRLAYSETTCGAQRGVEENRRPAGEACSLLLAALGREPSDQATLRGHDTADRLTAHPNGMGEPPPKRISVTREAGDGEKCRRQESFGILTGGETDLFRGRGQPDRKSTRLNSSHEW